MKLRNRKIFPEVMAATQKHCKLDMKHGFMKSIIRNQVDRDNYDKEVKASKQNHKGRFNPFHKAKRPDAAVYVPPSRKDTNDIAENEEQQQSSDEEDLPKPLFRFEFEDKDGKIYKQYVMKGVKAEVLAQRMGYDRRLPQNMIKALEQWLQEEIDKRMKT